MGFRPESSVYHLTFEGTKYQGLDVRMTALLVGELLESMKMGEVARLLTSLDGADDATLAAHADVIAGATQRTEEFYKSFARHLVSWNVERQDDAGDWVSVPATLDGVRTQDPAFIKDIVDAWRTAVSGVRPNLERPSPNGVPALEASIPMGPSSPSPSS